MIFDSTLGCLTLPQTATMNKPKQYLGKSLGKSPGPEMNSTIINIDIKADDAQADALKTFWLDLDSGFDKFFIPLEIFGSDTKGGEGSSLLVQFTNDLTLTSTSFGYTGALSLVFYGLATPTSCFIEDDSGNYILSDAGNFIIRDNTLCLAPDPSEQYYIIDDLGNQVTDDIDNYITNNIYT